MATNGVSNIEDADMAECDGEKVVTMMDVLQEEQDFEDDANAVLGASDEKNCTYSKGYIKRQAIYACLTCCFEAKFDPTKRAGVCLACSLNCHENHDLVELYTKRNVRCDCGNPKFNSHPCQFTPDKNDLNEDNNYNQNFSGLYCTCHRPYPDPESTIEDDEMIQCIVCEDWLHSLHLDAAVPGIDQFSEMICKACMEKNEFLHDYSHLAVNIDMFEKQDIDVVGMNGTDDKLTNGDINTGNLTKSASDDTAIDISEKPNDNMDVDKIQEDKTSEGSCENIASSTSETTVEEIRKEKKCDDTMEAENTTEPSQNPSGIATEANAELSTDATAQEPSKPCEDTLPKSTTLTLIEGKPEETDILSSEEAIKVTSEEEATNVTLERTEGITEPQETQALLENAEITKDIDDIEDIEKNKIEAPPENAEGTKDIADFEDIEKDKIEAPPENAEGTKDIDDFEDIEKDKIEAPSENAKRTKDIHDTEDFVKEEIEAPPENAKRTKHIHDTEDIVKEEIEALPENAERTKDIHDTEDIANEEIEAPSENAENTKDIHDTEDIKKEERKAEQNVDIKKPDEYVESEKLEENIEISENKDETSEHDSDEVSRGGSKDADEKQEEFSTTTADDVESKTNNAKNDINDSNRESLAAENVELPTDITNKDDSMETEIANEIISKPEVNNEPKKTSSNVTESSETKIEEISEARSEEMKRKLSIEEDVASGNHLVKKPKLNEECIRPKGVKRVHKGATFWPSNLRQKLCTCSECLSMYKDLSVLFLIDPEDTVFAYETLGKERVGSRATQYEKGLEALSSLDRIQQINALTEYNKMKDKLLDFLKSFKDRKEVVKEEDIKAFFAGMKPKREPDGVYFCR